MTCRERRDNDRARQAALYSFLLSRGDKYTSMEQATDSVSLYPAYFNGYYHDSSARRLLTQDIHDINNDPQYSKIIISGNKGIKLANQEEAARYIRSEYKEVFKKLKKVRRMERKCGLNGQIRIGGQPVEAFLNNG